MSTSNARKNHRKGQQAKQAEKLAQTGMMQEKQAAYVSFHSTMASGG
jgi:hypothetical protein